MNFEICVTRLIGINIVFESAYYFFINNLKTHVHVNDLKFKRQRCQKYINTFFSIEGRLKVDKNAFQVCI